MKLLVAALVLTFTVAIVATVVATWASVADAPWESAAPTTVPIVERVREPSRCDTLTQQLADAQSALAVSRINTLGKNAGCWR